MPTARAQPAAFARVLPWSAEPLDVLRIWPAGSPLACLISGGTHGPRARWSIFAVPTESVVMTTDHHDPLGEQGLDRPPSTAASELPFQGGWIAALSYELGRVIEPTARAREAADAGSPPVVMQRCPGAYVHDRRSGAWYAVGDETGLPAIDARLAGESSDMSLIDAPRSLTGRARFESAVAQAVEYVRAGDIFQANIAHHLRATVRGERRAVAARMLAAAGPWYGAYIELPDGGAVTSVSPELFLEYDPRTRRVLTRPIKGTRAAEGRESRTALKESDKERAELTMIVDLMRNDLGRVCAYGSVAVDDPRAIEHHGAGDRRSPGVYHGVATVSGVLREGLSVADLLRATFPPGSVTGAPKIRAMQIIDELEQRPRGFYCGAVGYLSDCGKSAWNVAIRTATLRPIAPAGTLEVTYPVGAGIVADSNPAHEWEETMHKAGVLMAALGVPRDTPSTRVTPGDKS